jgi:hypothetical protein
MTETASLRYTFSSIVAILFDVVVYIRTVLMTEHAWEEHNKLSFTGMIIPVPFTSEHLCKVVTTPAVCTKFES